ncbi:RsfA family transcriptional regulator [Bacillus sp. 2205SS5-2]|uniref:RsfA family transcriptional regulator n=1 Tax=Bacillus sp. 2205SS5-2 TaxID=3109031 RepID=UPI003006352C
MSSTRQDAWSQDEDLLLAEVVLRHIREGGTQLQAFEEVGQKLSRTGAACGFRWNSFIRKQYRSGIELAKKQRKEQKMKGIPLSGVQETQDKESSQPIKSTSFPSLGEITSYLNYLESTKDREQQLAKEKALLEEQVQSLTDEYTLLQKDYQQAKHELSMLKEDHLSLLSFLEKARKMAIHSEEESEKVKFQMDKNGNLQRLSKK